MLFSLKPTSNNRRQHIAYMCVFWREWYYHGGTSTFEALENFLQFLLPGGFYCLLRAHYENSGVSWTGAENSNWGKRDKEGVLLWSLQQAIQIGYGIWSSSEFIQP
jgi:hypothetical protein